MADKTTKIEVAMSASGMNQMDKAAASLKNFAINAIIIHRFMTIAKTFSTSLSQMLSLTETARAVHNLHQMAESYGISAQRLQAFTIATAKFGADNKAALDALSSMSAKIANFVRFGDNAKLFWMARIHRSDLKGLDVLEQTLVVAEKVKNMAPEMRNAFIRGLLGDQHARTIGVMLSRGQLELIDDMNKARSRGLVITDREIGRLEHFNIKMSQVKNMLSALRTSAVSGIANVFNVLFDNMGDKVYDHFRDFKSAIELEIATIEAYINSVFKSISLKEIQQNIGTFFEGWGDVAYRLIRGLLGSLMPIGALLLAWNPIVLALVAGVSMLVMLMDSIFTYLEGGDSIFEYLRGSAELEVILQNIYDGLGYLKTALFNLLNSFINILTGPVGVLLIWLLSFIFRVLSEVVMALSRMLELLTEALNYVLEPIMSFLDYAFDLSGNKNTIDYPTTNQERAALKGPGTVGISNTYIINSSNPPATVRQIHNTVGIGNSANIIYGAP